LPQVQPPKSSLVSLADHGDVAQRLGAVADDVDVLDRGGDLAVLDQPAVLDVEGEVAGADLDLAVGEGLGDDALLHGGDDLVAGVRAVLHVRAAHARHGRVAEGLAAAGAGGLDPVVAGADAVVQVGGQHAVVDEDGLLGRVALVVDVEGAALAAAGCRRRRW
jgi:hypothetical protein